MLFNCKKNEIILVYIYIYIYIYILYLLFILEMIHSTKSIFSIIQHKMVLRSQTFFVYGIMKRTDLHEYKITNIQFIHKSIHSSNIIKFDGPKLYHISLSTIII